jgi:quercetin dioxygenase-like cupin family protein
MSEMVFVKGEALVWSAHAKFRDVRLAWLMRRPASAPFACALVRIPDGGAPPEHVHASEDDILYVLRGGAHMWVEGAGEIALKAGDLLRVPAGARHRPHDIAGDFLAFNIWASNPA